MPEALAGFTNCCFYRHDTLPPHLAGPTSGCGLAMEAGNKNYTHLMLTNINVPITNAQAFS